MTGTAAGQLRDLLRLVHEHEQGARDDRDPEHVHQLRVSVRRMRAILRADKRLDRELRWFGGSLGAVRDLDVQSARLSEGLAAFSPAEVAAGEPLLDALRAERAQAREQMLDVFDSARYRELLDALASAEPQSIVDKKSVAKAYRRVDEAVDALGGYQPDDALHELRVKAKRLRYAAELADGLGPVAKAAKDLQSLLGEHQDASVADATVRRLLDGITEPATVFVAGRLVQAEHDRKQWCRSRMPQALATLREAASSHPELTT